MGGLREVSVLLLICFHSSALDEVAAGAAAEPIAKAAVRLYDYAAVPYQTLADAEREASRIFREAGVNLLWMECGPVQNDSDPDACEQLGESMRLVMRILPETMAVHLHRPPRVFGMSVQQDAFVFFDRVQELCGVENLSLSVILGHTMAHELGHMILGQRGHSPSGIMMDTIRKDALTRAEKGHLLFTPQQAAEMRARLRSQALAKKQ